MGDLTLSGLARREAVLLSFLGVALALGAVGKFFGLDWLFVGGLVVAVVGAVLRLAIALRRSGLEGQVEEAERRRRMRVPIAPVNSVDPTEVGVDAAPPQTVLEGGRIPKYLPREVDADLDAAIEGALDGAGPWIVVAVGNSKVGKSRALFEALVRRAQKARLNLVAPVDANTVAALLEPGEMPALDGQASALWLDDLEPFINQGMTLQMLREWRQRNPGSVVVGTYGGKGSNLVRASDSPQLATSADEILQHGREVLISGTNARELEPLQAEASEQALKAIERHGLAAYLVAAPKLERKLNTGIHETGEQRCLEGVAIVHASVDWARCGRTDPIPEQHLRQLWPDYLPQEARPTDAGFEAGLEWALKPVAGSISLVEHANGYRPYDYAVRFVEDAPDVPHPPDSAWRAALAEVGEAQALAVGFSAFNHDRHAHAVEAFEIALRSSIAPLAAMARVNLGITLRQLDRDEEAIATFEEMERFRDSADPVLREGAAVSAVNRGITLSKVGRPEEAIAAFDEVADRYRDASEPGLREQVARALHRKGLAAVKLGRMDDAAEANAAIVTRFSADPAPRMRRMVASAMFNRGVNFTEAGEHEKAIAAYGLVVDEFEDAEDLVLRERVAMAMRNKGSSFGEMGDARSAISTYREVVSAYGDATDGELPGQVAKALLLIAVNLSALGDLEEGLAAFDEALARAAGAEGGVLETIAMDALGGKAATLAMLKRYPEALAIFDQIASRMESSADPLTREVCARALLGQADVLGEMERHEDELAVLRDLKSRFGAPDEAAGVIEATTIGGYNAGTRLAQLGRHKEAVVAFDELLARTDGAEEPELLSIAASAMLNKGGALKDDGQLGQAVEAYGELVRRFENEPALRLREGVAKAMFNQGNTLDDLGRKDEADAIVDLLLSRFGEAPEEGLRVVVERAKQLKALIHQG